MLKHESIERYSELKLYEIFNEDRGLTLCKLIDSGAIEAPADLTFAAEIIGGCEEKRTMFMTLLRLLKHHSAVVREGALYGVAKNVTKMPRELLTLITALTTSDSSSVIKDLSRDLLEDFYDQKRVFEFGDVVKFNHQNGTVAVVLCMREDNSFCYLEAPGFGVMIWKTDGMFHTLEQVSDARSKSECLTRWNVSWEEKEKRFEGWELRCCLACNDR